MTPDQCCIFQVELNSFHEVQVGAKSCYFKSSPQRRKEYMYPYKVVKVVVSLSQPNLPHPFLYFFPCLWK